MNTLFERSAPEVAGDAPVVYTNVDLGDQLDEWLSQNRAVIESELLKFGAVLFRGFPLTSAADFNTSFKVLFGDPLEYTFRTSPREEIGNRIYTSTSHPADQVIHFHTENSYSTSWNQIISFFCETPSLHGGETPIADERRIAREMSPEYREKFLAKGIKYVRNSLPGIGLDWRTIHQTDDKAKVEAFLANKGMSFQWVNDDHLRTEWILPAFHRHPVTDELVWFNHMYFGHKSLYDPIVVEFIGEENLPFITFYGDGTPIEDEVIAAITQSYERNKIVFSWQRGDLLLMDNMLFSHGRNPYEGPRKILVAMARIINYQEN